MFIIHGSNKTKIHTNHDFFALILLHIYLIHALLIYAQNLFVAQKSFVPILQVRLVTHTKIWGSFAFKLCEHHCISQFYFNSISLSATADLLESLWDTQNTQPDRTEHLPQPRDLFVKQPTSNLLPVSLFPESTIIKMCEVSPRSLFLAPKPAMLPIQLFSYFLYIKV